MTPDYGEYRIVPPATEEELSAKFDEDLVAGDEEWNKQKDEELLKKGKL